MLRFRLARKGSQGWEPLTGTTWNSSFSAREAVPVMQVLFECPFCLSEGNDQDKTQGSPAIQGGYQNINRFFSSGCQVLDVWKYIQNVLRSQRRKKKNLKQKNTSDAKFGKLLCLSYFSFPHLSTTSIPGKNEKKTVGTYRSLSL